MRDNVIFTVLKERHPGMSLCGEGVRQLGYSVARTWLLTWPLYQRSIRHVNEEVRITVAKTHSAAHIIQYPRIVAPAKVDVEGVFSDTQGL
jgi:hypothetical protein